MGDQAGTGLIPRTSALALRSLDDMLRFAEQVVKGKLCPAGDTAATVAVKLQAGAELGFSPVQSLSVLTVINGRIGIMGVGALARLRASGALADPVIMGVSGEGEDRLAWIETRRRGDADPMRSEFAVRDAKRAGLWGKSGVWTQYPDDMLQWRAVSRHCKRHWSDVLLGLDISETIEIGPSRAVVAAVAVGPDPLLLIESDVKPESAEIVGGVSQQVEPVGEPSSLVGASPTAPVPDGETACVVNSVERIAPDTWEIKTIGTNGDPESYWTKNEERAKEATAFAKSGEETVAAWKNISRGRKGLLSIEALPF